MPHTIPERGIPNKNFSHGFRISNCSERSTVLQCTVTSHAMMHIASVHMSSIHAKQLKDCLNGPDMVQLLFVSLRLNCRKHFFAQADVPDVKGDKMPHECMFLPICMVCIAWHCLFKALQQIYFCLCQICSCKMVHMSGIPCP